MRQDAYECVCLFQTILNNVKFAKCLARFKGESNRNLSKDFTISVEDAICIALSKQDDYCRSRPCITSEEMLMQLLFYHYRSSRYIIWRSSCRYYSQGRYKYSCIAKFIHREKNLCLAGIHASQNHVSRNHASRKSCITESCIASH